LLACSLVSETDGSGNRAAGVVVVGGGGGHEDARHVFVELRQPALSLPARERLLLRPDLKPVLEAREHGRGAGDRLGDRAGLGDGVRGQGTGAGGVGPRGGSEEAAGAGGLRVRPRRADGAVEAAAREQAARPAAGPPVPEPGQAHGPAAREHRQGQEGPERQRQGQREGVRQAGAELRDG